MKWEFENLLVYTIHEQNIKIPSDLIGPVIHLPIF